jgi:hypothetical protein
MKSVSHALDLFPSIRHFQRDICYVYVMYMYSNNMRSQSLEVSKIKKNKKNFEKVWSSIINKGSYEMRFLHQHVNND